MSQLVPVVGECRYCHCTAANPCKLATGDECCWVSRLQDLCTRSSCLIAEEKRKKRERYARKAARPKYQPPWKVAKRDANGKATHYVRAKKKKGRPA